MGYGFKSCRRRPVASGTTASPQHETEETRDGAFLPRDARPGYDRCRPQRRRLLARVKAALACDSMAEFRRHMRAVGFDFTIHGVEPTLLPINGRQHIGLPALGLRTGFWLRFLEWGEDWASLGWGQSAPVRFWRSLTDDCLDAARSDSVEKFCVTLGVESVADAMLVAAQRLESQPACDQFRYFCGICWNRVRAATDVVAKARVCQDMAAPPAA